MKVFILHRFTFTLLFFFGDIWNSACLQNGLRLCLTMCSARRLREVVSEPCTGAEILMMSSGGGGLADGHVTPQTA